MMSVKAALRIIRFFSRFLLPAEVRISRVGCDCFSRESNELSSSQGGIQIVSGRQSGFNFFREVGVFQVRTFLNIG